MSKDRYQVRLTEQQFQRWLHSYGRAWQAQDAHAFSSLFDDGALYQWTPYQSPQKGKAEIAAAFNRAVGRQRHIAFSANVASVQGNLGIAHWQCAFTRVTSGERVHIDGIFVIEFAENGKAASFKEWWHSDERE